MAPRDREFPKSDPKTPTTIGNFTLEIHRLVEGQDSPPVFQWGYRFNVLGVEGNVIESRVGDAEDILNAGRRTQLETLLGRLVEKAQKEAILGEPDPL